MYKLQYNMTEDTYKKRFNTLECSIPMQEKLTKKQVTLTLDINHINALKL